MKNKKLFTGGLILSLSAFLALGAALSANVKDIIKADAWSGSECGTTWYIIGTINGQNWDTWNKLELSDDGTRYEYTFTDASTVKFKLKNVNSWDGGIELNAGYGADLDWSGKGWTTYTQAGTGNNFETRAAGTYTVYFDKNITSYNNGIWAFGIEKPATYKYSINGGTAVQMVRNSGSATEYTTSSSISLSKGDYLTFLKDDASYVVDAKDDDQLTKVYKNSSNQLVAAEDFDEYIYLDTIANKLWAGQFTPEKYYVIGDFNGWNAKTGVEGVATGDGAYKAESVTVTAGQKLQFVKTPTSGNALTYYHPDATKIHTSTEVATEVVGDDLVLTNAGTYDVYYNPTSGWYSVENPSWTLPYTIQVGSTTYPLTLNTGTEYQTALLNLTSGQSVTVLKNGVADTTFNRKAIGNNNVDASGNVIATVSQARIYIDINAKTLFVGGMEVGGYHVLVDNVYHKMTQNPDPLDPSYREFYSSSLSFAQNAVVRLIDTTASSGYAVLFDITNYSEAPTIEGSFTVSGGHIVASKAVQSAVYLKLKSGADEIYFGDVSEDLALAIEYAQNFLKAIQGQKGGVCKQDGTTDITALDNAWTTQKTNYAALGGDVAELKAAIQQHLKDSHGSSNEDLAAFSDLYDVVLDRHAKQLSTGYDFLGRNISGARYTGAAQIFNETNLPLILIIGVSVLAITSVGAVVYLKVRKHD